MITSRTPQKNGPASPASDPGHGLTSAKGNQNMRNISIQCAAAPGAEFQEKLHSELNNIGIDLFNLSNFLAFIARTAEQFADDSYHPDVNGDDIPFWFRELRVAIEGSKLLVHEKFEAVQAIARRIMDGQEG